MNEQAKPNKNRERYRDQSSGYKRGGAGWERVKGTRGAAMQRWVETQVFHPQESTPQRIRGRNTMLHM